MEIKQVDRTTVRLLGDKIEEALQAVAKEYGVAIKRGNGTFEPSNFTMKIECSVVVDGNVVTKEAEHFKRYATFYGMKPEDLGKTIRVGRDIYEITGMRLKAHKYPILGKRPDGRTFYLPLSSVKPALGYKATDADITASARDDWRAELRAEAAMS